jgi:2-keto-3-deoxy-6-phosphogluconate aldolase
MEYTHEQLAVKRRQLALEYKEKMKELAEIKKTKAIKIIELLPEHNTINKAELYYSATEDGQKEIEITYYCKGLLETMRALKSEIDIKQSEAYNQY